MPLHLQTEPPITNVVDEDSRRHAFYLCVAVLIGLSFMAVVLHYHFR